MFYRLTSVSVRLLQEKNEANREFNAPDDLTAINHSERPQLPLKIIDPVSGEAVATVPRKLIELTEPPRVVKEW